MDMNFSATELAFRDEVRAWLAGNLPTFAPKSPNTKSSRAQT
jgi:hypothetical protein